MVSVVNCICPSHLTDGSMFMGEVPVLGALYQHVSAARVYGQKTQLSYHTQSIEYSLFVYSATVISLQCGTIRIMTGAPQWFCFIHMIVVVTYYP